MHSWKTSVYSDMQNIIGQTSIHFHDGVSQQSCGGLVMISCFHCEKWGTPKTSVQSYSGTQTDKTGNHSHTRFHNKPNMNGIQGSHQSNKFFLPVCPRLGHRKLVFTFINHWGGGK